MSYKCPLKNPQRMAELFSLLHKTPSAKYQDNIMNEASNNALLLDDEEQAIIASGRYSIRDVLYGRYYWYTKFLCHYEATYGRNGSMEQAQFKIIEAMDHEGIVDSDMLEAIEQELGYVDPPPLFNG